MIRARDRTRRRIGAGAVALCGAALLVAGCGGSDFQNKPRPPVPVQLTGVITKEKVVVSPNRVGAGPVVIIVSNQTGQAHTLTLDGGERVVQAGPIQPSGTGRLQDTLHSGTYRVKAGTETAQTRTIAPATLRIGPKRQSSSNTVLLP